MRSIKLALFLSLGLFMALGGQLLLAQQVSGPEPAQRLEGMLHRMSLFDEGQSWLGVQLGEVTQAKVKELKLPGDYGAIVTHVEENSPAAKAGLKENDVILEFGGMRVWSAAQLKQLVDETPPGRNVSLRVSRYGQKLSFNVTMAPLNGHPFTMPSFHMPPINFPPGFFRQFAPFEMQGRLGVKAEDLTPQLASYFGVKQGKGVLVTEVEAGSAAAQAGLKAGDCIVRVDMKEVDSVADLRSALRETSSTGRDVTVAVVRKGREESLRVHLQPSSAPDLLLQQEAQDFATGLERQVRQLEKQIPRLEREEERLQSCLTALETHLFGPQFPSRTRPAVIRRQDGSWLATGPGCPSFGG